MSLKDKLLDKLGNTFGYILYYFFLLCAVGLPLGLLPVPFWAMLLIALACILIPYLIFPLWIWAFISAVTGPQDFVAIAFYCMVGIYLLYIIIVAISSSLRRKK